MSVPGLFKLHGASRAMRIGDEKSALRSRIAERYLGIYFIKKKIPY